MSWGCAKLPSASGLCIFWYDQWWSFLFSQYNNKVLQLILCPLVFYEPCLQYLGDLASVTTRFQFTMLEDETIIDVLHGYSYSYVLINHEWNSLIKYEGYNQYGNKVTWIKLEQAWSEDIAICGQLLLLRKAMATHDEWAWADDAVVGLALTKSFSLPANVAAPPTA